MYRTLDDLEVKGKRVLVRADFNLPMSNGQVTDATRIVRQAPTIRELASRGARIIVLSHFGRPKGKVVPEMSLKPVVAPLAAALGQGVAFATDCIGGPALDAVAMLQDGDVVLLENTRFHPGEETDDPAFAQKIAALGDLFVNDAFSAAHRAHATTHGLAHLLPAAAGRSMQAELEALTKALEVPRRPVMAVVGGAKISTKITLLENLLAKVDILFIGGAMANTFLAAQNHAVGNSLTEPDQVPTAKHIIEIASKSDTDLVLPIDVVVANALQTQAPHRVIGVAEVADQEMILDIGPKTVESFDRRLQNAATLVWNGPLGAFETPPFDAGTTAAAKLVAERTRTGRLLSVAGGGDTVAALEHAGVVDDFTYVSTAGGAFLEWLEGRDLPGVTALNNADGRASEEGLVR